MFKPERVDRVLRNAVERGDIPGAVAMVATADGPVYQGAFGKRSLPGGAAMTVDTVFWIASMTKAITSAAAMQLVERGQLSLSRPIAEILPELGAVKVLEGFDAAGEPKLRRPKRPITLGHLLTHTAGFGYDTWSADLSRYVEKESLPRSSSCKNLALATPLTFDPGDQWQYGINIDWVGKAVERASGQNLEAYFREHLFEPLGMTDTSFKLNDSQRARLVGMHARQTDGSLAPMPFEIPQEPEFLMGGGGLYGTAEDYLAFARMILHDGCVDGRQILKPETVRAMAENQIGDIVVRRLVTAKPMFSSNAEFFPGMVKKWSYGFMINTRQVPGGRGAGSLAWAGLGNTYFWIDPAKKVVGVLMTQLFPFADAKVMDLLGDFENGVYAGFA